MNLLLMTATVTPPAGAPGLMRVDPQLRLRDYQEALSHYLGFIGRELDAIVFAENSRADVSSLRAIAKRSGHGSKVEFVVFDGMDHPPGYGRCTSEARLLDHAMSHSETVARAGATDVIWKVTGRYRLMNLPTFTRGAPSRFDFYCDLRHARSPWADMRLMAWNTAGYEATFRGIGEHIREDINLGRPGEESLFHRLKTMAPKRGLVTAFRREPLFDGVRAFDNRNWSLGRQRVVFHLRQMQRLAFNAVWI
jgi:hypothetical protein